MRCRWCGTPLPAKQAALALIALAPMAHRDPHECAATALDEPTSLEDRDWTPAPPDDADVCGGCRGHGEVPVGQEWETGAPVLATCTWCKGTGRLFPWLVPGGTA